MWPLLDEAATFNGDDAPLHSTAECLQYDVLSSFFGKDLSA
jgi:hypothetical protein